MTGKQLGLGRAGLLPKTFRILAAFVVVASMGTGCGAPSNARARCQGRDQAPYERVLSGEGGTLFQVGQTHGLVFQTGVVTWCDTPMLEGTADVTVTAPDGTVSMGQGTWAGARDWRGRIRRVALCCRASGWEPATGGSGSRTATPSP